MQSKCHTVLVTYSNKEILNVQSRKKTTTGRGRETRTGPGPLVAEAEAAALGVGAAEGGRLQSAVHCQHTALLAVGGPASVLQVPGCGHAPHHRVVWREGRGKWGGEEG